MVHFVSFVARRLCIRILSSLFSGRSEQIDVRRLKCGVQKALVKVRGSELLLLVDAINSCSVSAVNEPWSNDVFGICIIKSELVKFVTVLTFLVRIIRLYCE